MITGIILMNVERGKINEIAEKLVEMDGVSEVYSVSGRYDLIVVVRVPATRGLAELVTEKMVALTGITHTETMLAFKAYSKHDLASMFSIGLEE
jgi:DNA-binding Lrp family transcriptional regulator